MIGWGAMLPFMEDSLQVLRRGDFKNFFKRTNLGAVGLIGSTKTARSRDWWKNTFLKGPKDFTYGGIWPFAIPMAAYLGARAGQGHALSTSAGFLASMAPAGLGAMVAGGPGALAAGMLFSEEFGHSVRSKVQSWGGRAKKQLQFEMGDRYWKDTETAWTMRQRAVQEMSGSLLNARQVLGREAALMHQ